MGTRYLIDTNTLSDYFGEKLPLNSLDFIDTLVNDNPQISVMTRIESLSYLTPKIEIFRSFVNYSTVFDLTEDIILRTIALRRSRRIKIPDAIIAATALEYDLTLITHNTSDFQGIPNLKLLDAHSL
ncbi:type II toxin-antitoxin system VapC family toxin [Arcicella sp. LKC2W]|uniref:type II toxin-antitoxin system VapC family toxin n=1 Tax=Arcicella sp. LKC2W TaxID=2984198 RepID=UPI002B1F21A4|nr:type II toxin-antitoxin system VapC family toxin [Arcicella sp. LKC2W]MEA5458030.1 type II toxin-antitoxin system VapC family toxin [Arcicella sp. LKC2W]